MSDPEAFTQFPRADDRLQKLIREQTTSIASLFRVPREFLRQDDPVGRFWRGFKARQQTNLHDLTVPGGAIP